MSFTSLLQVASQREFLQVCDQMMQQVVGTRGHNNTEMLLCAFVWHMARRWQRFTVG